MEVAFGGILAVFIQTDSIFCQRTPASASCLIVLSVFSATITGNIPVWGRAYPAEEHSGNYRSTITKTKGSSV